MGSTITRKTSDHAVLTGASGLLDVSGAPAPLAVRLLDWQPEAPPISHGRAPSISAPLPRGLAELEALEGAGAAVVRVTGPDRESWIQGVQTADVRRVPVGGAAPTLFLNTRGRALCDGTLWRLGDELRIRVPRSEQEALLAHLEHHLIMEDAELSTAPGLRALRLSPGGAQELLGRLSPAQRERFAGLRGAATPLGFELLLDAPLAGELLAALPERPDPQALELHRLALGVPRWSVDFDADSTPLEAGLDAQIAFDKGCYVGQEVIAMATYRGRVPWNLVRLEVAGPAPAAGTPLDVARGGKGKVTSSAAAGDRALLLGLVHREKIEPGSELALPDGRTATVLGLPFGSLPGAGKRS